MIAGRIDVLGETAVGVAAHELARRGLGLLPEDRGIFFQLSVSENLRIHRRPGARSRSVSAVSYFPELERLMGRRVGLLSGGEQQMLGAGVQARRGARRR